MRDANDLLAETLHNIASKETINQSTKREMKQLAENLASVGDVRDDFLQELHEKVLTPISQYKIHCHNAKSEIRNIYGAKQKELFQRRQLGKLRDKDPYNVRHITKAESELARASLEVSHTQKALEEHIEIFERKKINDVKQLLLQFVKTELGFHAEAVGLFTQAYKGLLKIDLDSDFKDFRDVLAKQPTNFRVEPVGQKKTVAGKIGASTLGESLAGFLKSAPKGIQQPPDSQDISFKSSVRQDISARTSAVFGTNNELSFDEDSSSSSDNENDKSSSETTFHNYHDGTVKT